MAFWSVREELSLAQRLRRSYYELLRDELDQVMLRYALVDSYAKFRANKVKYPYVEKRELKPRAGSPTWNMNTRILFWSCLWRRPSRLPTKSISVF